MCETASGLNLPALTEKINRGAGGGIEFELLMKQLLLEYARRNNFRYESVGGTNDGGMDGRAPKGGVPGFNGPVAFQFKWLWDGIHKGNKAQQIIDWLERAAATQSNRGINQWILVTPWNLTSTERKWLATQAGQHNLSVHPWGKDEVEKLLRDYPVMMARYYPAHVSLKDYDGTDFREFARHYRVKVPTNFETLRTIGMPPDAARERVIRALHLRDLFIPLRLEPEGSDKTAEELASVLNRGDSVVVLGDTGMGKTTLLAYLALLFSGGAEVPGFTPPEKAIPLFISLREYVKKGGGDFLKYLVSWARERLQLPHAHWAFFESALLMGEAIVLVDGLDEVGSETARQDTVTALRNFRRDYPDCPFWITSRIHGYSNVRLSNPGFKHYRIGWLDDDQVDDFIKRWYAFQIPTNSDDCTNQAESLRTAVRYSPRVRSLASNPLLLTLMAFIHHGPRQLPKDRGALYEKCVEMLLKNRPDVRHGPAAPPAISELKLKLSTQKEYLARLAFFMQEKPRGEKLAKEGEDARGMLPRRDVLECLTACHWGRAKRSRPELMKDEAREEMQGFLEYICNETGLLVDRGSDQISFIHPSFQDYLAACESPPESRFFAKHLGDPTWEEVLLLRLYIILKNRDGGGTKAFDAIVGSLIRKLNWRDPLRHKDIAAAWQTLARVLRDDLKLRKEYQRTILQRVLGFWLDAPTFEGPWFATLAEVHRFGVRARGTLQELLREVRAKERKAARALAVFYLEEKLFGFPDNAVEVFQGRADLPEILSALVVFQGQSGIDAILKQEAPVANWVVVLRALDGPELYRVTLKWASASPSPVVLDAALGLIWEKILSEFRSRRAFADPRRGSDGTILFERLGNVTVITPFASASVPLSGVRALPVALSGDETSSVRPATPLLCGGLTLARLKEVKDAAEGTDEFIDWTTEFIRSALGEFAELLAPAIMREIAVRFVRDFGRTFGRAVGRDFDRDFVQSLVRDFVSDFVRDFDRDFVRDFGRAFGRDFGRDFVRAFVRDFDRDFIRDFVRAFVCAGHAFGRAFVRDFVCDFGHSVIHDFGRDFGVDVDKPGWETDWDRAMRDEANQLRLLESDGFWWMAHYAGKISFEPESSAIGLKTGLENPLALPFLLSNLWNAAANQHLFTMFRHMAVQYSKGGRPGDVTKRWLRRNPVDVYAVAFAWKQHATKFAAKHDSLSGREGALFLAHAAYASLMTGLECQAPIWKDLLDRGDLDDPRVRISRLLYELCLFRDAEKNAQAFETEIKSAPADLRPVLEAAGLVRSKR